MLAAGGESRLDLEGAPVVSVRRGHRRKGGQTVGQGLMVARVPSRVTELKRYWRTYAHEPRCGQWPERCGHRLLRQAGENACVGEVAGACHLPVGAPRCIRCVEVEPPLLAQQRNELEPPLGMHDLPEGSVDGLAERPGPEDGSRLTHDILINFDRGLRHVPRISRRRRLADGPLPRTSHLVVPAPIPDHPSNRRHGVGRMGRAFAELNRTSIPLWMESRESVGARAKARQTPAG